MTPINLTSTYETALFVRAMREANYDPAGLTLTPYVGCADGCCRGSGVQIKYPEQTHGELMLVQRHTADAPANHPFWAVQCRHAGIDIWEFSGRLTVVEAVLFAMHLLYRDEISAWRYADGFLTAAERANRECAPLPDRRMFEEFRRGCLTQDKRAPTGKRRAPCKRRKSAREMANLQAAPDPKTPPGRYRIHLPPDPTQPPLL